MPYYHATKRDRLDSIRKLGLRAVAEQNFRCEPGVYLADNPAVPLAVMVECALLVKGTKPSKFLEDIVVIVIDDAMVNKNKLEIDPQGRNVPGMWLYRGVIDITNAPILDVDTVLKARVGI